MQRMDLTHLEIFDISGVSHRSLKGTVSENELASLMIEEWIPYFECHKCGRYDYCKFRASPHPANPNRSEDIRCGVTVSIIKNFVNSCFPLILKCNIKQKQDFLDAAFYFYSYINFNEQFLGAYLNKDIVNFFGNNPLMFGHVTHFRNQLDKMAEHLKSIPEFKVIKGYLLVEGEAEKEFVKTLKESHLLWFNDILVESYGGKGNMRPNKLEMLAQTLTRDGYEIYIQGDQDSHESDIFVQLVQKGIVKLENTFAFIHDFESSIPNNLIFEGLKQIGHLNNVSLDEFCTSLENLDGSINTCLNDKFGIDDSIKVPLAREIARLYYNNSLWGSKEFMQSELGKFIDFIKIMP